MKVGGLPAGRRTHEGWSEQMGHTAMMMSNKANAALLQDWWGQRRLDPCQPWGPPLPGSCHLHPPALDAQLT